MPDAKMPKFRDFYPKFGSRYIIPWLADLGVLSGVL